MTIKEEAFGDDRSNTLIVTAAQRTQKKIGEILANMEDLLQVQDIGEAPKRYRLEVVLLRGGREGEDLGKAPEGLPLGFEAEGFIERLYVKSQARVEAGDVIVVIGKNEDLKRMNAVL